MELITIRTKHTTYQMGVNQLGVLLHLYYGPKAEGDQSYLLTDYDRGFSGNTYDAGADRSLSLDVLPRNFPAMVPEIFGVQHLMCVQSKGYSG